MRRADYYTFWYWYQEDNMAHLSRIARSMDGKEKTGCGQQYDFSSVQPSEYDIRCPNCKMVALLLELGE